MKKTAILVVLLISNFLFAQEKINIEIKKSEIIKEDKKHTILQFSDSDNNGGVITVKGVYTRFGGTKAYKIEHFNANLKLVKSITLENEKKTYLGDMFVKDGVINLIQFKTEKDTKGITVNVLSSSITDLKFTTKKLYTLDREEFKKYFVAFLGPIPIQNGLSQMDQDGAGMVTISKNKNYLVLSFDIKNKKKESHLFVAFDSSFNRIYKATFQSEIADKYFEFEDIDISDENGDIFLLGKVFENKSRKTKKKGKTNYHYELYKIKANKQDKLSIKETENFIGSLYLLHQNKKLVLVGFYSNKGDYRYKGVCRFDLKDDLTIENKSFQPFNNQFFEDKYKSGAKVSKKRKELRNLDFKSVFLEKDGSVIINAEEFYITQHYVATQNGGYWTTTYHFNDIITVKLDANGKLLWARNINKAQTLPATASFTAIDVNGKNYIFINASDKIKKLSNNRIGFKQTGAKKSNLYVILIDKNGEMTYKKLIDDKESKVWYKVSDGIVDTKNNSVIFQGVRKKYQRILSLTIK